MEADWNFFSSHHVCSCPFWVRSQRFLEHLHHGDTPLGSPVSSDYESELTDVFFFLLSEDTVSSKLQNNNVYTIAKRNVEGQDMLYQSLKLTNGIWILAELRIQPGNPNYTVRCRAAEGTWRRPGPFWRASHAERSLLALPNMLVLGEILLI